MNTTGIHPDIQHMVRQGTLSQAKVRELIRLKQIVRRFAVTSYVSEEEALELEKKYGARPGILSWDDYFQTEIASQFFHVSDDEFVRIVDTVRFDLISSKMIFTGKGLEFFEEVEQEGLAANAVPRDDWTAVEEEAAHLWILLRYYKEMGLEQCTISPEDREWFDTFVENSDQAAG